MNDHKKTFYLDKLYNIFFPFCPVCGTTNENVEDFVICLKEEVVSTCHTDGNIHGSCMYDRLIHYMYLLHDRTAERANISNQPIRYLISVSIYFK